MKLVNWLQMRVDVGLPVPSISLMLRSALARTASARRAVCQCIMLRIRMKKPTRQPTPRPRNGRGWVDLREAGENGAVRFWRIRLLYVSRMKRVGAKR